MPVYMVQEYLCPQDYMLLLNAKIVVRCTHGTSSRTPCDQQLGETDLGRYVGSMKI